MKRDAKPARRSPHSAPFAVRLVTGAEMRDADRRAREAWGLPSIVLMENAATAVLGALTGALGDARNRRVLVLAGKGGNGGDGLALARHLSIAGADVQVVVLAREDEIAGDTRTNLAIAQRMQLPVLFAPTPQDVHNVAALFAFAEWVVDAIFGVGGRPPASARATPALPEPAATAVNLLNPLGKKVIAVDLPSGLDPDRGAVSRPTVQADLTVTLGAPKFGLFSYPGAAYAGRVTVADIGMPAGVWTEGASNTFLITADDVRARLPRRSPEAHKKSAGRVLVVGGSPGMAGAVCLAAEAAYRSGAGYVTVAAPASILGAIESRLAEAVKLPLPVDRSGALDRRAASLVLARAADADAVVLGPGLGRGEGAMRFARDVLGRLSSPTVVDADALHALTSIRLPKTARPLVVTPHPGEAAELLGTTSEAVQGDRLASAHQLARRFACHAVLKGARTLVSDGRLALLNPSGGPALATAGTGDVLAGTLGALLAQGLDPLDAALCAVHVHGLAGDLAAADLGERSVMAGDVLARLSTAFRSLG